MAQKRYIKIILAAVASLNGKITNGMDSDTYKWSSKEDRAYFFSLVEQNNLIIMGRKTYEVSKHLMQHKKGKLRIILTSHPERYQYQTIPDQLEFVSESPQKLVKKLSKCGFTQALLVGGARTNAAFLRKSLVDELWLTIEPLIFKTGIPVFAENLNIKTVTLLSVEKLNFKGTLLLRYSVGLK